MNTVTSTVRITSPHFKQRVLNRMFKDFPMGEAVNGNLYSIYSFVVNAYRERMIGGTVGELTLLNNRLSHLRYKLFVCDLVDSEACRPL